MDNYECSPPANGMTAIWCDGYQGLSALGFGLGLDNPNMTEEAIRLQKRNMKNVSNGKQV
jgi:hypothetical protein